MPDKPEATGTAVATRDAQQPTLSERFSAKVEQQFLAEMGSGLAFSQLEKRLTQHMYLKVDSALAEQEKKRVEKQPNKTPFVWANVNMPKLALDTVHRVSLGLDALIPNHVAPVFYLNSRTGKYDVDLQIGYVGLDYIAREHAVEPPLDIIYEVVYSTDEFHVAPRTGEREHGDDFHFKIANPFDRGDIVGGFGYIVYDDPRKNRLVLVTQRDFKRSQNASRSNFWRDNDVEMHYKTVVRRTASKIRLDTKKVNSAALAAVTADEYDDVERAADEVTVEAAQHANRRLVDVDRPASNTERYHEYVQTGRRPDRDGEPEAEPGQFNEGAARAFDESEPGPDPQGEAPAPEPEPADEADGLFPDRDF